jgi:hypothetical protein
LALLIFIFPIHSNSKEIHRIPLEIIFVDNLMEIPDQIQTNGIPHFLGIYEMTNRGICRIYLMKPKSWEDYKAFEILGHEVHHCYTGIHSDNYIKKHYK